MCLVLGYAHEHMPAEDPLELELTDSDTRNVGAVCTFNH